MTNPLDPGYLFSSPDPLAFGTLAIAYLVISVLGLIIALYFYNIGKHRQRARPALFRAINLYALVASIVFGVALFFYLTRFLAIPILSWHLWPWLTAVVGLILALAGVYHYLAIVPVHQAAHAESLRLRRYQPGARPPVSTNGSAPTAPRGDRRRKRKKR